jgi:hypothetical protein
MVSFLNLRKVQIFGDSKIVVDWVNRKGDIQVVCLAAHKAQVREFLLGMEWFSFNHIYHEMNKEAYNLSKDALELHDGTFCYQEYYDGQPMEGMTFYM